MANKKMFWLGILVMVLVFGMTVVGCDDSSTNGTGDNSGTETPEGNNPGGNNGVNPFDGSWTGGWNVVGATLVFTANSVTVDRGWGLESGTYTRNGNTATFKIGNETFTATVSGEKLTITDYDNRTRTFELLTRLDVNNLVPYTYVFTIENILDRLIPTNNILWIEFFDGFPSGNASPIRRYEFTLSPGQVSSDLLVSGFTKIGATDDRRQIGVRIRLHWGDIVYSYNSNYTNNSNIHLTVRVVEGLPHREASEIVWNSR